MPFSIRKLTKLQFVAFCLMALLGFSTFAFSWSDWVTKFTGKPAAAVTLPQSKGAFEPPYILQVMLRPEGFEPNVITIPKGKFKLILSNRSGVPDPGIQLSKASGNKEKLKDIPIEEKKSSRWNGLLDLTPGDYVITATANPNWMCKLTIDNK